MLHDPTESNFPSISATSFAFSHTHEFKLNKISFTLREFEIMACIISGRTSRKAIASMLFITPGTVATHLRNVMNKLKCNSLEAIREIIEHSDQLNFLQDYYKHLLWQERFNTLLLTLRKRLSAIKTDSVINLMCSSTEYPTLHNDLEYLQAVILYLGFVPALNITTIGASDISDSSLNLSFSSAVHLDGFFVISSYDSIDMLLIDVLNEIIEPKLIADLIEEYRNVKLENTPPQYYTRTSSQSSFWERAVSVFNSFSKRSIIISISLIIASVCTLAGYRLYYTAPHSTLTRSDLAVPIAGTCLPRTELVTSIQHKLRVDQPIIMTPINQTSRQRSWMNLK